MAIEVTSFKPLEKGTLRGFFSVRMTNIGIEIHDASLHEKNGRRWVALPAKPYQKADGTAGWAPAVSFYDKGKEALFRDAALKSLDQFNMQGETAEKGAPF